MLYRSNLIEQTFIKSTKWSKNIPGEDSFFNRAFKENMEIAVKSLNTTFIQKIKNGDLPPDTYGSFSVLDSYYCYNCAGSFRTAYTNAKNQGMKELAAVLLYLTERFETYNKIFLTVWHIADSTDVVATDMWKAYADHEKKVAQEEPPIYTLVSMLPCYHLWFWISDQIISYAKDNLYGDWIIGCHDPSGAYMLGSLIEDWKKSGNIFEEEKALEIYHISMEHEYKNFAGALAASSNNLAFSSETLLQKWED